MIYLRNISGVGTGLHIYFFQDDEKIAIDKSWYVQDVIEAIVGYNFRLEDGDNDMLTLVEQLDLLKGDSIKIASIPPTPLFASPKYNWYRVAQPSLVTVQPSATVDISYQFTTNAYSYGGMLLTQGAEFGDYITASICDLDGVIPMEIRNNFSTYPILYNYIKKEFITPNLPHKCSSYPLSCLIQQGLYIVVGYTATGEGVQRKVAFNYFICTDINVHL